MTGDELAAALYAEQGFLVIECSHEETLGSIVNSTNVLPVSVPVVIKEPASREQFLKQARRACELSDDPRIGDQPAMGIFHYYRVEAAD